MRNLLVRFLEGGMMATSSCYSTGHEPRHGYDTLSVQGIPPGPLRNCVSFSPTKRLSLASHCIALIQPTHPGRVASVHTVPKRTGRVKLASIVSIVDIARTLIAMPRSTYPGPRVMRPIVSSGSFSGCSQRRA
jgi:hypothetical protein